MKKIEEVSVNEVIWRLLSGHHGAEVMKQNKMLLKNAPNLLLFPDFDNWEENIIRRGALSLCANGGCPVTSLILRVFPKSEWNDELKFSRYLLYPKTFFNLRDPNYNKKLYKAIKKYKNNKYVLEIRKSIEDGKFDFDLLDGIIAYKIGSKFVIIDGTHRAMAILIEFMDENISFPEIKIIILENKINVKRKLFFFKKQYKI